MDTSCIVYKALGLRLLTCIEMMRPSAIVGYTLQKQVQDVVV